MKKILFLLLIVNSVFAQNDSVSIKPIEAVTDSGVPTHTAIKINEVIVSSTRAGDNSPTAMQVLTNEELAKSNLGQDIPFLLDNTPSVVTTSDAGAGIGYTGIRIRGSDNSRINVTLNGIPVNDAESQGTFWVDIPDVVSSVQSIQIQRGVGTSTNGPGAFGGTISLQTQSPSQKAYGEAAVSGGSFSTFKGTLKAGTGIHRGFFAEGSASWITSEGYIDRASSNLRSYFAQLGYLHNNTLVKLLYFGGRERTYQAWNGVPEDSLKTNRTFNDLGTDYGQHFPPYKNQVDNYEQDYFQLLFAQQLPKNIYLNLGLFATLGRGYYEEYKVAEDFNAYFPAYDTVPVYTDLVRQKWLRNIFYGATWSLTYQTGKMSAVFGGLFGQFRGQNYGHVIWADKVRDFDLSQRYYDGRSTKNDFNVYAKFNYEFIEKVNLFADVQYRYVGHVMNGIDDGLSPFSANNNWHFVNPKAGVLYKVKPQHHVYASFALGNREPNRSDILASTVKQAKPETLYDVEAGYKFLNRKFPVWLNFYYMYYKDQLVLTGRLNDVGSPIKENVDVSYRAGLELSGSFNFYVKMRQVEYIAGEGYVSRKREPYRFAAINYNFAYSLNKIKSFDEYLYTYDENYVPVADLTQVTAHKNSDISFSPGIVASLELALYPVYGLEVSFITKAVSKQYLDNTSSENRKLKPFWYSNLRISYKLPLNRTDKEIRITTMFNNVFNKLFESNGYTFSERYSYTDENGQVQATDRYTYNYYYPQAGFNFLGGINVRF